MQVVVKVVDPLVLADAQPGHLFIVRTAELQECVCAICEYNGSDPKPKGRAEAQAAEQAVCLMIEQHFGVRASAELREQYASVDVVVVGCRVDRSDPAWHPTGKIFSLSPITPVQFVEPMSPPMFREVKPRVRELAAARLGSLFGFAVPHP